jgi:phosphoribosylaminoimidazolecarboxamide formyltransferase/IMP cyclohydrolase
MIKVKRALISVSDKKGLLPFAKGLQGLGVEILSTGGTAKHLRDAGIAVKDVSDYTGFPEILDGRVKTLHPAIHAGLLAVRENPEHMEQLKKLHMGLIDMVVVNLYPFESVVSKKNVSLEEAIENIDIGGPTMLRSAAKNYKNVAVIVDPDRYADILKELQNNSSLLSDTVLYNLAVDVFHHTARYDRIISSFLTQRRKDEGFSKLPNEVDFKFLKVQDLRYGENPHQQAAFYRDADALRGLPTLKQLHGKELSFNNILDLNAAVECLKDFENPAAVVIKHNNPTGIAEDNVLKNAFVNALKCDPVSAFGGIIGLNRRVDVVTAQQIQKGGFMECVIAPSFDDDALKLLSAKKNIRLIAFDWDALKDERYDVKKVYGGLLYQERDEKKLSENDFKIVTNKKFSKTDLASIFFGWKAIKGMKSNAIALVKGTKTVGIGCGQTSRVESVRIAIQKAGKNAKGSILISDAFLPKMDNVQLAAKAGVKGIVQTGGSIADEEVTTEADKKKMAMVMTGIRHFKH